MSNSFIIYRQRNTVHDESIGKTQSCMLLSLNLGGSGLCLRGFNSTPSFLLLFVSVMPRLVDLAGEGGAGNCCSRNSTVNREASEDDDSTHR